jgi:translation initiation factor 4E
MNNSIQPWVLYYHETDEKNWTKKSYHKIWEFNSVEDFWSFFNNFEYLHNGMLFFMRQNVFPLWEEPENINGGQWSIKVPKYEAHFLWTELTMSLIGEYFTTEEYMNDINGISITPKPKASLIKIWHSHSKLKDNINFKKKREYMYKKFKKR